MKLLFDLFPVILFFATYKIASHGQHDEACLSAILQTPLLQEPILLATLVAILATFAQVGWLLFRRQKVDAMLWLSLTIIVIFGGATLYFHNPDFIQWKPTILYWLFGTTLLITHRFFAKNLIRQAMEAQKITLPEKIWGQLNLSWAIFFICMGCANLWAAKSFSCDTWVSFKLYGLTGCMLTFIVVQGLWLGKYIQEENP